MVFLTVVFSDSLVSGTPLALRTAGLQSNVPIKPGQQQSPMRRRTIRGQRPASLMTFKPNLIRDSMSLPSLDADTLGLKETFRWLLRVGLVAWCCRNMRSRMRPVRAFRVDDELIVLE
jgi:hypothetical protein